MRKIFAVLLVSVLLVGIMSSCSKKNEAPKDLDLEQVYSSIIAAANEGQDELVMFPEGSDEIINSFYPGFSELTFKQCVLYMPPISGWASEVMLVEATDEDSAKKAADVFQARIDLGASDTTYPETAEAWAANAQVQCSGNYVAMIALPPGYIIPEDVFAL